MRTSYRPEFGPSAHEVRDVLADEIRSLGGRLLDEFEDGDRFIGRALLDSAEEIRPGDVVNGGIAVRVGAAEILVHPYTFRQVCTNGAIAAHALGTLRIERIECTALFGRTYEAARILAEVGDAVRACAAPESFMLIAGQMRFAADRETDAAITMAAMLSRFPQMAQHFLPMIFERFTAGGDNSAFGFMNAVTSVARDTRDPEAKWQLEALGGECLSAVCEGRVEKPGEQSNVSLPPSSKLVG